MNKLITFILLLVLNLNGFSQQKQSQPATKINVLFVGNSLTYEHKLPKLVKRKARSQGYRMEVTCIAYPDFSIRDHLNGGKIQQLLKTTSYDFLVIQQGPSSSPYGKESLIKVGEELQKICAATNTTLCYYMVWPAKNQLDRLDNVIANYEAAAKQNKALLIPVGRYWRDYIRTESNYLLYGKDGFHPSLKGAKMNAEIIANYLVKAFREPSQTR